MIAYLNGTVAAKSENQLILDVQGIGYRLEISSQTFQELPREDEQVKLLVHHHFTDSEQRLFGFLTTNEKELFELLITVKRVGPKLALTILSGMSAEKITGAIVHKDTTALSKISGIGKKTAERMILELKDKMPEMVDATYGGTAGGAVSGTLQNEAVSALQSLGFKKRDAEQAVYLAAGDGGSNGNVQDLLKKALSSLNS